MSRTIGVASYVIWSEWAGYRCRRIAGRLPKKPGRPGGHLERPDAARRSATRRGDHPDRSREREASGRSAMGHQAQRRSGEDGQARRTGRPAGRSAGQLLDDSPNPTPYDAANPGIGVRRANHLDRRRNFAHRLILTPVCAPRWPGQPLGDHDVPRPLPVVSWSPRQGDASPGRCYLAEMGKRHTKPADPQEIARQRAERAAREDEIDRLRGQGAVVKLDRGRRIVSAYRQSPFVKLRDSNTITAAQARAAEKLAEDWAIWRGLEGRPERLDVHIDGCEHGEVVTDRMLRAGKRVSGVLARVGPLDRELLSSLIGPDSRVRPAAALARYRPIDHRRQPERPAIADGGCGSRELGARLRHSLAI